MPAPLHPHVSRKVKNFFRKIRTDEADIKLFKYKGKPHVLRIVRRLYGNESKMAAHRNWCQQALFHAFFPQYSLYPKGISYIVENGNARYGMVSEVVRKRTSKYFRFLQWRYLQKSPRLENMPRKARLHRKWVDSIPDELLDLFEKEAGFRVDLAPQNVMNVNGRPLFVEVSLADKKKALAFLENHFPPEKRTLLQSWLRNA
ncbi:MAG: hypothetical protein V1847_04165 [Candidatus Diapherotrites archaeon]